MMTPPPGHFPAATSHPAAKPTEKPSHRDSISFRGLLYTAQGAKSLLEGGGRRRRAAAEQAANSVGGKIECFYFAFGDADAFVIADVPDHASASAVSLAVSASGGAHCKTIVLMTPEEVDQASKKPLTYTGGR